MFVSLPCLLFFFLVIIYYAFWYVIMADYVLAIQKINFLCEAQWYVHDVSFSAFAHFSYATAGK